LLDIENRVFTTQAKIESHAVTHKTIKHFYTTHLDTLEPDTGTPKYAIAVLDLNLDGQALQEKRYLGAYLTRGAMHKGIRTVQQPIKEALAQPQSFTYLDCPHTGIIR
jgi:hypothetical protein